MCFVGCETDLRYAWLLKTINAIGDPADHRYWLRSRADHEVPQSLAPPVNRTAEELA
jgi:hypothetical protein